MLFKLKQLNEKVTRNVIFLIDFITRALTKWPLSSLY